MPKPHWTSFTALTGAMVLGACSPAGQNETQPVAETPAAASTAGVTRDVVAAPTPTPAPAPAAAIQTQPGPKGSQVALNSVSVSGDVLTVSMTFSGGDCWSYIKVNELSVIDDATSQRLGVLKDNAGNPMAAPLYDDSGKQLRIDSTKPAVVWAKFPAPPATSTTVSIAIPEVGPFDAVPITR